MADGPGEGGAGRDHQVVDGQACGKVGYVVWYVVWYVVVRWGMVWYGVWFLW